MCIISFFHKLFIRRPMDNIYLNMVNYVQKHSEYNSYNGRDILWFPLQVPQNKTMRDFLQNIFENYHNLLNCNIFNIKQDVKDFVYGVYNSLLDILQTYERGNILKAHMDFEIMMKTYFEATLPTKYLESNHTFYRMRANEHNLREKKEFYNLPSALRHKCASYRFSIAGYPCLYLGYSRNVCFTEISQKGSMCGLTLKQELSNHIKILDLTFAKDQSENQNVMNFIKAWPLIASCYIVMANEQINRDSKFREEYIIPQMLTAYLKHNTDYAGICYYSTRNENLKTDGHGEDDYRNIILFTKDFDRDGYDMDLINKFKWYEPFNV